MGLTENLRKWVNSIGNPPQTQTPYPNLVKLLNGIPRRAFLGQGSSDRTDTFRFCPGDDDYEPHYEWRFAPTGCIDYDPVTCDFTLHTQTGVSVRIDRESVLQMAVMLEQVEEELNKGIKDRHGEPK